MESFKLSNSTNKDLLIFFEPIGDMFTLPANEFLQIVPYGAGEGGLGVDCVNVEMKMDDEKRYVVVWAETHKFEALYNGRRVNVM